MPDNSDSVMVVLDDKGQAAPSGWTRFASDGFITRRVAWSDVKKLELVGYKSVLISCFQKNGSGSTPFRTDYDGQDSYSIEYNALTSRLMIGKNKASGGGAGTTRNAHKDSIVANSQGGADSETWPSATGQVPLLGVVYQDSNPSTAKINAARALTTDDVSLG